MRNHVIAAFAGLSLFVAAASSQEFVISGDGEIIFSEMFGGAVTTSSTSSTTKSTEGEEPASERQQKLSALTFDRRPSAILKAWSEPEPEPVPYPDPLPEPPAEAEVAPAPAEPAEPAETTSDEAAAPEGAGKAEAETAPDAEPADPAAQGLVIGIGGGGPGTGAAPAEPASPDSTEPASESEAAGGAGSSDEAASPAPAGSPDSADPAAPAAAPADPAAERAKLEAEHAEQTAKALEAELALFQRHVTLGRWDEVRAYLASLPEKEAAAAYTQLVKNLAQGPPRQGGQFQNYQEKNYFEPTDVAGLFAAAHVEVDAENRAKQDAERGAELGQIVKRCVDEGNLIERCVEELVKRLAEEDFPLLSTDVARAVIESGHAVESGVFLPAPDAAIETGDRDVLNLVARHHMGLYDDDGRTEHLEAAWRVTQAALAEGDVEDEVKAEALARATGIAPKLREELGDAWLQESFTERPERGMEILSVIGTTASSGMSELARVTAKRLDGLKLQTTACEALLSSAPERAGEWGPTLSLLAANWLREADYSRVWDRSTKRGPAMQRDAYGNVFYYDFYYSQSNRVPSNQPQPIATAELLDIRPSDAWLEHVAAGLAPRIDMVTAQLLLKVGDEESAFPFIERLAPALPDRAGDLVEEFLRVWAENNNPNGENQRTNSYMFMFGFETRANAIPLTRSKQQRNLANLAGWIERIRALPSGVGDDVDEEVLAKAFVSAHSTAEVFRLDTIEGVFGDLGELEPRTLAELVQTMRTNLVGIWRRPDVQKDAGTRRREKDIRAEVLRGYEVADGVIERALADHPDDWSLVLARAAVAHDLNDFKREVENDSGFAERRAAAMGEFARAAELYARAAPELDDDELTAKAFDTWFYAALGASDLAQIDHRRVALESEFPRIKAAIEALPGELAERHLDLFANALFTRMSGVNPAVKFRYVRAGLGIVGDNDRAADAREVYDYYADLVSEIRLTARVDGGSDVGTEPFGLFVSLEHTREIEREAGGFSKYLINQNNQAFSYNYGRPTEDYRDKFEEAARESLSEQFEVLSVTFNHPDTTSRALPKYGWRETPYCYVLLRARGPETDRVPPLRLDLDFLDTSGYAVLPIESAVVPIDANAPATAHACEELHIVQTLDERRADEGALVLEVKATARGLVPELDDLLAIDSDGFDVAGIEDQGLSISEFDREADEVAVKSDRTWLVSLVASDGLAELPSEFTFAAAKLDAKEVLHQRYVDEDLESVEPVVALERRYGEVAGAPRWPWALAFVGLAGLGAFAFTRLRSRGGAPDDEGGLRVPEQVTPFTVLGLLEGIGARGGLADADRAELEGKIAELEAAYFRNGRSASAGSEPTADLEALARDWVRRAR